jgi:hypothetical protein
MGIGSSTVMRDQRRETSKTTTDDTTDTPIKITRHYQDFPAPSPTPRRSNVDARSLGTSRPQGARLQLSPEQRAQLEAKRLSRGAAASVAGRNLRVTGGRSGSRFGTPGNRQDSRIRTQRRREDGGPADDSSADSASAEAQAEAHVAPPPRQWLPHTPEDVSLEDLQVDWPVIPTGKIGIIEGVSEKLRWLARRLQHGYDTPQELARRLHMGNDLVHFKTPQEKEEVLQIAREMAERSAERMTEKTGMEVKPKEVKFECIRERDRAVLVNELVRGVYPPIEAGKSSKKDAKAKAKGEKGETKKKTPPFLNDVLRILSNNQTYHAREKDHLYYTITKLLADRPTAGAGVGG